MNIFNLPRKNIVYFLIIGAGLLAIISVILFVNYRALTKLDANIARMKSQIAGQESFSPVFQELFKKLRLKKPDGLVLPPKAVLPNRIRPTYCRYFRK